MNLIATGYVFIIINLKSNSVGSYTGISIITLHCIDFLCGKYKCLLVIEYTEKQLHIFSNSALYKKIVVVM